ncbi:MAG TPA: peptide chain release factor 3 [Gemmatimonadaceae bacterium]|nr:peptide chain release factor 3 [Gemmatimonadaceae bacterium]
MTIETTDSHPRAAGRSIADAIRNRRTFAIISHPDAGKTTLTEKLLLYGGAIHLAGSVKARRAERHATSDWMELERQRGISVTSSVLQFEYAGYQLNLLDTPGHQDFSEDTYRTLIAADSAVMLLDNRRGVEDRTRQLFDVCKRRRMPIVTFVNKCDRAGADPLALMSGVEADLGIACYAATWPIHRDGGFVGVYDRRIRQIYLFDRGTDHGAQRAGVQVRTLDDPELRELLGAAAHERLVTDVALLDEAGHEFSHDALLAGEMTPIFFGSALTNFGVEPFLREFLQLAPPPSARESSAGVIEPTQEAFTGFVFKIQANMDPRHRDRVAFVRVCSGRFEAGMQVTHVRSRKPMRLSAPQQFLARDRSAIEEAWPGDVIGVVDKGTLRIGDTLSADGALEFSDIPRFAPEHFARITVSDPLRRKHLDTGLRQLTEEGAAQVFYAEGEIGPTPIVGAVGLLQFDVMLHRLEHEYGVPCRLERLSYRFPRWVTGAEDDIARIARARGHLRLFDAKGNSVLVFEDAWALRSTIDHETKVTFSEIAP